MLISWISRRISNDTAGRPQRRRDFQRQYSRKPARCQRITVSGRTIASASYILGNSRQIRPNISLSIDANRSLLGLARRKIYLLPQHQNLRLERCARPQKIDHCSKDKFAQIKHRAAASPDSRSTPSGLDLRQGQLDRPPNSRRMKRPERQRRHRHASPTLPLISNC